jgi:hypothetical protein
LAWISNRAVSKPAWPYQFGILNTVRRLDTLAQCDIGQDDSAVVDKVVRAAVEGSARLDRGNLKSQRLALSPYRGSGPQEEDKESCHIR